MKKNLNMQHQATKPTAVIVGMEKNGLGVARALSVHNIPAIGLAAPDWDPSCETNACDVIYGSSWTRKGLINDLKLIGQKLTCKAPLIITKDEPVLWISESRQEIADLYEINLPEHPVVELLMNKSKFYEMGVKEGWPFPITWQINNKEELICRLKEIVYPCILKPQVKNSEFRKHAPRKAFIVRDEHELITMYDLVAQWEPEVVIQEWIGGGDDRVAFCLTYCNRQGEPIACFPGRKLRQYPIRCGNTAIAEPAPKEWEESIISLTGIIFRTVGFKGLGSIEYKMRPDTDTPVIMEPTVGRTNFQSEIAVLNGVNIPSIAYHDLIKQTYHLVVAPSAPVKLINGVKEIRSAFMYWRTGELELARWLKERSGRKKYMTFRLNDLGPFIASGQSAVWAIVKKLVKVIIPKSWVAAIRQKKQKRYFF